MIPEAAVKAYLKRSLDDHLWVKELSAEQLDVEIASLVPRPNLNPKLRVHQRACFLIGVARPQFCYWLDMGVGKTILSLELLRYWFQCGVIKRALIFVTSDKAFDTWEKQLKRFEIDLPLVALAGSSEQKWKQLEEAEDGLVLVPYPGALAMVCDRVQSKGKQKFKLNRKKLEKLSQWGNAIVLDESTRVGSHNSASFKMVEWLRDRAKVRYALAGRPFGRDPTMLWAQHYLIDGGETLGETLGLFRAAFFTEKPSFWGGPYSKEYTFKDKLKPQLAQMIRHRSITYAAAECIDMPKVVPIREVVAFSGEAQQYYERVVKQVIAARGNLREMKNAFLRMRQISSGFVGFKTDDENSERVEIEFQENPKLERLLELVEEVPEGSGACVFYAYTHSGRRIVKELKALGHKPIWLWSGTKDSKAELARFAKSERPIAVLQNQIGSMSIDGLQHHANYCFFYESAVGVIDREQAERRLVRDGQEKTVFLYDLICEGTVDEKVLDFHLDGEDLMKALLRNPEKVLLS